MIGDSWINGEDLDPHIIGLLSSYGWEVDLDSFGKGGARTRKIYNNLFLGRSEEYSSYPVLFSDDPYDFVVIVSGLNDSGSYMGPDFYAHHLALIVRSVINRGSVPVIVELPEFGIEYAESNNPVGFIRRRIFRWIWSGGEVDVIASYREAFEQLRHNFENSEYIFVSFDSVAKDYEKSMDIYSNPSHLNDTGNYMLSKAIVEEIDKWLVDHWK